MGIFSFLKAEKKEEKRQGASADNPFMDTPKDDLFKAYIPEFLYKPPFGYPLRKNIVQLKDLAKNPYIFSIIRTLKDEASTSDWEIKLKRNYADEAFTGKFDEKIKQVTDWFYNPNGNEESFGDIVSQWVVDLCEVDAAVGVKVFNKAGDFSQLFARDGGSFLKNPDIHGYMGARQDFVYPVDEPDYDNLAQPHKIKVYAAHYAEQAAYFQYGWTGNALPVPFGKREIMYIMSNARSDNIYGRSPLEILYDTLLTLIYGQQYNLDFYLNGNTPEGMIHLSGADQDITKAFQDKMKSKFQVNDALGYTRRIGHIYPVYGGPEAKFVPFQLSAKDMEIIEQQKWFTKLVWSAFGVTPEEMGYSEDSNKAVAQNQSMVHKRKALRPLLKRIEYVINTQLMPELDPECVLEFKFVDYDIEEENKKYDLYQKQVNLGIMTPKMIAEKEGINVDDLEEQTGQDEQEESEDSWWDAEVKASKPGKDIVNYFKQKKQELLNKLKNEKHLI